MSDTGLLWPSCLIHYRLERSLYVKFKDWMSNSVDPDETAHYAPSHLVLCCLQKTVIIACDSERIKLLVGTLRKPISEIVVCVLLFYV